MPEAIKHRARAYETIYILRPDVDPDSASKVASRISDVVGRLEGKLVKVDQWGKRKLAYPVKKHARGVCVYVKYLGYSDLVAEVERNLRLLDSVIKYQTVMVDPNVDPSTVEVDPEDVKFRQLEQTADEPELGIEHRLGLVQEERHVERPVEEEIDRAEEEAPAEEEEAGEAQ